MDHGDRHGSVDQTHTTSGSRIHAMGSGQNHVVTKKGSGAEGILLDRRKQHHGRYVGPLNPIDHFETAALLACDGEIWNPGFLVNLMLATARPIAGQSQAKQQPRRTSARKGHFSQNPQLRFGI